MINQKLHYLVKWKGFELKHNLWEPWENVHTPELITDFHWRHPRDAHHIRAAVFDSIPFQALPSVVLGHHSFEGGVDVRGHPVPSLISTLPYILPYQRLPL
jgi:Chromo (CHRromatin Organisation MOdifier) domain